MRTVGDGALNASARATALERMAAGLDLLVVGGGITGAGAALDAAARGLSVGLVEARDLASGASSKSSKLIHGGLRYLEMGDIALVREALRERELLLRTLAPHLVSPVPFLWPLRGRGWERLWLGAGLVLYDTLGGARSVPRHRHLTRTGALREAPGLSGDGLVGAVQFYDAAEDDARMVATVARTAAARGAQIATRAEVLELSRSGSGSRAPSCATTRAAQPSQSPRATSRLRQERGRTACERARARAFTHRCGRRRGFTSSSRATGSRWPPGCSPAPRRASCS